MKVSTALLLLVPACLAAQGAPPMDPANPITSTFRSYILGRHRLLAAAFDSIPADKYNYKPTDKQLTIGYIAQHLASDSYFFCSDFGDKKPTRPAEDTETADSIKAKWPKDKLVSKLKESFAFCADAITQVSDAKLSEMIGTAPRQVPRAARLFGHSVDMADHYSQIANYMRLNGMLPPSALPRPNARP